MRNRLNSSTNASMSQKMQTKRRKKPIAINASVWFTKDKEIWNKPHFIWITSSRFAKRKAKKKCKEKLTSSLQTLILLQETSLKLFSICKVCWQLQTIPARNLQTPTPRWNSGCCTTKKDIWRNRSSFWAGILSWRAQEMRKTSKSSICLA